MSEKPAKTQNELKLECAIYAVEKFVSSNMQVGLGSGSTAEMFVEELAKRVQSGSLQNITCTATSEKTGNLGRKAGLTVIDLNDIESLDVAVDGADEIEPGFEITKGGGGNLLWEKLVAVTSKMMIIIADDSKLVQKLGEKMPIPVEVIPFGWEHTAHRLQALHCQPVMRKKEGEPYHTDSGNYILDCKFAPLDNPRQLAQQIKLITGVVEHGLFVDIARHCVIAAATGVYELEKI